MIYNRQSFFFSLLFGRVVDQDESVMPRHFREKNDRLRNFHDMFSDWQIVVAAVRGPAM